MPARLVALTEEARRAIDAVQAPVDHFPFKVGRESRTVLGKMTMEVERRLGVAPQLNDLYLVEPRLEPFLHVSREHFLIESDGDGYFLTDRGSACGTIINGRAIGGDRRGGRTELRDHDIIIVGRASSPFAFKFRTE